MWQHASQDSQFPGGPTMPAVPVMPESPARAATTRPLLASPNHGGVRDWEGFIDRQQPQPRMASSVQMQQRMMQQQQQSMGVNASVSQLVPSVREAQDPTMRNVPMASLSPMGPRMVQSPASESHQRHNKWKREEYERRLDAEARGEMYRANRPYSQSFVDALSAGPGMGSGANRSVMSIDFEGRSQGVLGQPQVVGTREEISWLSPPTIPLPVGWNGFWDLCSGHEQILQLMAVSGTNQNNSPSLTEHFMYPELLSCFQRLQYGTYMVLYSRSEPPHERYFYVKSLPLANKAQYCPFLCWSTHRHAHQATDCIPLCNVMWVTQGADSPNFEKYAIGGEYIQGPRVGKKRAEMLVHGAMTIWFFDKRGTRSIDVLATDPLVFTMWMKLLEDIAQLNAALDTSGSVRALQRDLESSRETGALVERFGGKSRKVSILS